MADLHEELEQEFRYTRPTRRSDLLSDQVEYAKVAKDIANSKI